MTLAAKLQDVELQLQRVTQVVQLHVKLTEASVNAKGPPELDASVLALVDGVERAQSDLHEATTQLLTLAKCVGAGKAVEEEGDGGDTETEYEMEDQVCVRAEDLEVEENAGQFLVKTDADRRSSLEKYTFLAKNAVKIVIDPEEAETVEAWRRIVEVNELDANKEFLDQLSGGKVEEEVAVAYSKATTFAVSVLTSYEAMSQKPSWLMQLVEDLTGIQNAAKDTDLARVLAPVEKCRDDLITYCSRNDRDALDDMSNYVVLIERHRGVQANRLLPYLLTLLRKFICDCTDYSLRQDVVGEAPRAESQWTQFCEIGVTLANWMQIFRSSRALCKKLDAQLVDRYFQEFETRFPGRLPAALIENWSEMVGNTDAVRSKRGSGQQTKPLRVRFDGEELGGDNDLASRTRVAGKKRDRANPDITEHLSKRVATAFGQMKPCEDLNSCTFEIKVKEHLKAVRTVLKILNKCKANQLRLQCLVNCTEFDTKINRVSEVLPGSIPAPLAANVRRVFGVQ
ncbi:hypothetical protein PF003_g22502 [Phytophthora fragariae]|nr:hypothetical protein PF003_g22502 [Phytophthora fragariae]